MRITFQRTGGFAGIAIAKVVDTATLPRDEANQLRHMVDAADFYRLPAAITPKSPQPDRFQYRITLEENGKQHTVVVSEQAAPGTLRPLLEWLMARVRRR